MKTVPQQTHPKYPIHTPLARWPAGIIGALLTAVGLAFNASYGWTLGGDNLLRAYGMAAVFVACVLLKDAMFGQVILAAKARRFGLAVVCALAMTIGAAGSFLAAFGAASDGQTQKSDPRQHQIVAFKTAEDTARDATERLAQLGPTLNTEAATTALTTALAHVDIAISRRTELCTKTESPYRRIQTVNSEACQPVVEARATKAKAEEASEVRKTLAAARETLSRGAPKAADPLASNLASLYAKITGQGGIEVASIVALIVSLIVELGAPLSWGVFQMHFSGAKSGTNNDTKNEALKVALNVPQKAVDKPLRIRRKRRNKKCTIKGAQKVPLKAAQNGRPKLTLIAPK